MVTSIVNAMKFSLNFPIYMSCTMQFVYPVYLLIGATHAAVVSLPFSASMAYCEGERFCSQLISLREHIAFRKLGTYGKSTYRKHHSPENINNTLQPSAITPSTISEVATSTENSTTTNTVPSAKTNIILPERDNIPPTSKPMPVENKPCDVPVVKLREPSPPPNTDSRYVYRGVCVLLYCMNFEDFRWLYWFE